ncbi:MAG: ATP-binding cassette domain-containing protein [Verrucomicrobiales bacterium]
MFEYSYDGSILRVKDLHLAFGESVILKGVNFEIKNVVRPGMEQGQVLAILGPSGIGKTQIFRSIAGLDIPTATVKGSVTIGETHAVPVRAGLVGVVSQHYPLFKHRKVLENLVIKMMNVYQI